MAQSSFSPASMAEVRLGDRAARAGGYCDTPLPIGTLKKAELLGSPQLLRQEWNPDGLVLQIPETRPSDDALVIKLS